MGQHITFKLMYQVLAREEDTSSETKCDQDTCRAIPTHKHGIVSAADLEAPVWSGMVFLHRLALTGSDP